MSVKEGDVIQNGDLELESDHVEKKLRRQCPGRPLLH